MSVCFSQSSCVSCVIKHTAVHYCYIPVAWLMFYLFSNESHFEVLLYDVAIGRYWLVCFGICSNVRVTSYQPPFRTRMSRLFRSSMVLYFSSRQTCNPDSKRGHEMQIVYAFQKNNQTKTKYAPYEVLVLILNHKKIATKIHKIKKCIMM